jgi:hypothetical protein
MEKPWLNELDKYELDYMGYKGYALRNNSLGCLCGYAVIDSTHPLYEQETSNEVRNLNVHWGITYANNDLSFNGVALVSPEDNLWVLGFDTAHCDDLIPYMDQNAYANPEELTYRDIEYVMNNIKKMIEQLVELKGNL